MGEAAISAAHEALEHHENPRWGGRWGGSAWVWYFGGKRPTPQCNVCCHLGKHNAPKLNTTELGGVGGL